MPCISEKDLINNTLIAIIVASIVGSAIGILCWIASITLWYAIIIWIATFLIVVVAFTFPPIQPERKDPWWP